MTEACERLWPQRGSRSTRLRSSRPERRYPPASAPPASSAYVHHSVSPPGTYSMWLHSHCYKRGMRRNRSRFKTADLRPLTHNKPWSWDISGTQRPMSTTMTLSHHSKSNHRPCFASTIPLYLTCFPPFQSLPVQHYHIYVFRSCFTGNWPH